jgi:hypothetical protein
LILTLKFLIFFFVFVFHSSCASLPNGQSEYQRTFQCAKSLANASIPTRNANIVSPDCIFIPNTSTTYVYTNQGVQLVKNDSFFSDEQSLVCKQIISSNSYSKSFAKNNTKYAKLLLNQFKVDDIRPVEYSRALIEYKSSFKKGLEDCKSVGDLHSTDNFNLKINRMLDHMDFLSGKRSSLSNNLKYKTHLKRLKQISADMWQIQVEVSIVNNGKVEYTYASDCDEANAYEIHPSTLSLVHDDCDRSYFNIKKISPYGVYRHKLLINIPSKKRPSNLKVTIYFSAVPSLKLGTVIIPQKKS